MRVPRGNELSRREGVHTQGDVAAPKKVAVEHHVDACRNELQDRDVKQVFVLNRELEVPPLAMHPPTEPPAAAFVRRRVRIEEERAGRSGLRHEKGACAQALGQARAHNRGEPQSRRARAPRGAQEEPPPAPQRVELHVPEHHGGERPESVSSPKVFRVQVVHERAIALAEGQQVLKEAHEGAIRVEGRKLDAADDEVEGHCRALHLVLLQDEQPKGHVPLYAQPQQACAHLALRVDGHGHSEARGDAVPAPQRPHGALRADAGESRVVGILVHSVGPELVVARHLGQSAPPGDPSTDIRVAARRARGCVEDAVADARASHGQDGVEEHVFFPIELGAEDAKNELRQALPKVARQRDAKPEPLLCNVGRDPAAAGHALDFAELLPHQAGHPPLAACERHLLVVVFEVV